MLKIAVLSRGPSFAVTWRKVDPHGWGRLDAEVARIYQEVIGVNDIPTPTPSIGGSSAITYQWRNGPRRLKAIFRRYLRGPT